MHLPIQFQSCQNRQLRGHNHHRLQWKAAIIQVGKGVDSSGPGGDVPIEVAQAVEPTTKSHVPVEEHDESLVPKRQKGRPATHCWPSPGITRIHSWFSRLVNRNAWNWVSLHQAGYVTLQVMSS